MEEIRRPDLSPRFDVDDIRKIRDYNSLRHSNMTHEEIIAELRGSAEKAIKDYHLQFTYAAKLPS